MNTSKMMTTAMAAALVVAMAGQAQALGNRNSNHQGQGQGQAQGQLQGQAQGQLQGQAQKSVNNNNNNSRAIAGAAAGAIAAQKQSANNEGNSQNVNINEEGDDFPASTAYAPALAASPDTCMGSTSAGAQGLNFGLSLGTTWVDTNCMDLKWYREMAQSGYNKAAAAVLCEVRGGQYANALKAEGIDCAALTGGAETAAVAPVEPVRTVSLSTPEIEEIAAEEAPAEVRREAKNPEHDYESFGAFFKALAGE